MFGLGAATQIYVAVGATDMRKGFEGLNGGKPAMTLP
jgi:transposase